MADKVQRGLSPEPRAARGSGTSIWTSEPDVSACSGMTAASLRTSLRVTEAGMRDRTKHRGLAGDVTAGRAPVLRTGGGGSNILVWDLGALPKSPFHSTPCPLCTVTWGTGGTATCAPTVVPKI